MNFKKRIASLVEKAGVSNALELLEVPPDTDLGDYALPCFTLAREMKKSPAKIAEDLSSIEADFLEEVRAVGPYVNFFVKNSAMLEEAQLREEFQSNDKKVVLEYSSPNIAKPFGIGHLRSTVIGAALKRIYEHAGWQAISVNHIGDWGTQFGKLIAAYKKWPVDLSQDPIKKLLELYVKFHEEAENNPELMNEGREEFRKLESGDEENMKLWEEFRKLSLKEFERVYERMNVTFDSVKGEAFYSDKLSDIIALLEEKGLLVESDGAKIVEFDDKQISAPAIILKSDGATMYITRDIAALLYRKKTYDFNKMIYEVGNEQQMHFRQLFKIIKMLGRNWHEECYHVGHGLYRFPEGKMSTRRGQIVYVEEVFDQAVQRSLETIKEKNPNLKDKEGVAELVGVGAIIFNDLKNDRINDITFNWDEILDFEGESGPYLQYTHARLRSIIRKSGEVPSYNPALLTENEEALIARHLLKFKPTIENVISQHKPHILARYLLDLAQLINSYYQKHKVVQEDKELERARLAIIERVANEIKLGLSLLGINAVEEM